MKYELPKLPFRYDAYEPYIDEKTMKVHHDGHHRAYVDKLNELLAEYPDFQKPVEKLLVFGDSLPIEIRTPVLNNAGGHANHSLFWTLLSPTAEALPKGEFAEVLNNQFGSLDQFKEKFTEKAVGHFSNGWVWLCGDASEKLQLLTTKDHENPITQGLVPLLVLDVWEHAYYLKHQNRRPEFVRAFFSVINWTEVSNRWNEFKATGESHREWLQVS